MSDGQAAPQSSDRGITEQELRRTDLPVTSYVCGIPLYPVGGTVFLYGPPGIGKSFITQGLNHTITWGKAAGSFKVDEDFTSNVLYCDFESNANMVRERSLMLTPFGHVASDTGGAQMLTDTTYVFSPDWRGRTFPERLAELEQRLYAKESAGIGFSLVVLDTYQAFVGATPPMTNPYEYDRACIEKLNELAERCQVCILLIHHPNKSGDISGSVARAGTAWIVMSFKRVGDGQAVLKMEKNRVGKELELAFDWDRDRIWRLSADMPARVALAKGNNRVLLQKLAEAGPMTKAELLAFAQIPEGSLKSALQRLQIRGEVELLQDRRWRVTFNAHQDMPVGNAWRSAKECPQCGHRIHHRFGCVTDTCPAYIPENWAATTETELRQAEPTPDDTRPVPKWKQMARERTSQSPVPAVDASYRMDGPEKVYTRHPITAAVELIMADRDAGKLSPTWRTDLPAEITGALDGHHRFGKLPQRYKGELRHAPEGAWSSYDARGSFLASYRTPLCIKPLPAPVESDGSEWTRKHSGALEILTPEWNDPRIGHPLGTKAQPGTWQWIWSPSYRLLRHLAEERDEAGQPLIGPLTVRRTALRSGYQGASENLLLGFYETMKAAREHYPKGSEELAYVKEMYSAWLSSTKRGVSNVFKREDWWYSIRSEAFSRLWNAGWSAVAAGIEVLAMGNTDELVMRPSLKIPEVFPEDDRRIGKMTFKESGRGLAR